ncbi:MAG: hypothetical protein IT455_07855 [Planctomycetes bacterium]|nr:hypothetical protein [Planctomycetota bacterium]
MPRPDADAFLFLAPGFLHQLGNLLLTIHGTALTIDGDNLEHSRRVMLTTNDRGSASVFLLRALLGEPVLASAAASDLVEQIAELCRVPLRERGLGFELRRPLPADLRVDYLAFVCCCVEAVRLLAAVVPGGQGGGIEVALQARGRAAELGVRYRPSLGALPFPVPIEEVAQRLTSRIAGLNASCRPRADGSGLELRLDPAPAVRGAEA